MMEACGDAMEFQDKKHKTAKYQQFNNDICFAGAGPNLGIRITPTFLLRLEFQGRT